MRDESQAPPGCRHDGRRGCRVDTFGPPSLASAGPSTATSNEARARIADKVATIQRIRELAERDLDRFAGVSTKGPDDVTINMTAGAAAGPGVEAMEESAAATGVTLKRKYQKHSLRELTQVQTEILGDKRFGGPRSGLTSISINPDTNAVELGYVDESAGFAREVRAKYGDLVRFTPAEPMRYAFGRFNDRPLFDAGDRLVGGQFTCTSGFTITNLYGFHFALTAGHCWNQNTVVSVARTNNVAYRTFGTVDYRRFGGGNYDNALIGTDQYSGRMWSSTELTNDTTVSLPVHQALDSCDGCQVYFNGSITGMHLGTLQGAPSCQKIEGQTQCGLQHVVSADGGVLCQGGDSGGPVFGYDGRGGITAVGIIEANDLFGLNCLYTRIVPVLQYWVATVTTA
jgi:hypothetical protein